MRYAILGQALFWVVLGFAVYAYAQDYYPNVTYPTVEIWDGGTYEVVTPNGIGGFESFDDRGNYRVIETPRTQGAETPYVPLIPRDVERGFLLPHERQKY